VFRSEDEDHWPEVSSLDDEQAEAEAIAYALTRADDEDDLADLADLNALPAEDDDDLADGPDPVRAYLNEIGQTPVLSADQELRLCATLRAGELARRLQAEDAANLWARAYAHLVAAWRSALEACQAATRWA